jgi:hypothetical protein
MSFDTQVNAFALGITARMRSFKIQRLENGTLEYVSKGVTLDEQLIFAFDREMSAASKTTTLR